MLPGTGRAQDNQPKDARYFSQQALKAYRARDYAAYLENLAQAIKLRPEHPTIRYNLAGAYALNGKKDEAIKALAVVARMGLDYPASADDDFATIRDSPEFKDVLKIFESNKAPINHSSEAFRLEEKGLVTEGVAYDPVSRTFFISSVHRRKILSRNTAGEVREFSNAQDGLWSVLGMRVDSRRRHLWVATAALPQMQNFTEALKNQTGVFKYDLKTGKLLKKYLLADTATGHTFGDLAIHPNGDVYVTDSVTPGLYVIRSEGEALELVAGADRFASPQGLDFSSDGKQLFVADYGRGIFVFDVKSRSFAKLSQPENVTLLGVDGLYFHNNRLIAIQNGIRPHRVIQASLNAARTGVTSVEVIEANNPLFDEPTLGTIVGSDFYFIANSQWGSVNEKGELAEASKLHPPVVLKTTLRK
jgi:hypothetical protein